MPDFRESALILFKAALSAEPVSGTIIQAIDGFRAAAREKLSEAFQRRVRDLEARLDPGHVTSSEFAELFVASLSLAERTQQREKLYAAANILANSLLADGDSDKRPFEELDHFMRCVDGASVGALHVLAAAFPIAREFPECGEVRDASREPASVHFPELVARMPQTTPDLIFAFVTELSRMNLLWSKAGGDTDAERKYRHARIETTPLGYRFARFVVESEGASPVKEFNSCPTSANRL